MKPENDPACVKENEVEPLRSCIHCGLCLSSCPTFLETGNENLSPRGRIYLMKAFEEGTATMNGATVSNIDSCLGCRACETAYPSGVPYGELLEETRDKIEQHHKRSLFQTFLRRFFIEKIFPHPRRLRLALFPAGLVKSLGLDRILPRFIRDALDLVPGPPKTVSVRRVGPGPDANAPLAHMLRGCVMPVLFKGTNDSTRYLVESLGVRVEIPGKQVCCGALYAHSGRLDEARKCARRNIDAFGTNPEVPLIVNAAGCGSILKEYGELLSGDPDYAAKAKPFSMRVRDLTEWLSMKLEERDVA